MAVCGVEPDFARYPMLLTGAYLHGARTVNVSRLVCKSRSWEIPFHQGVRVGLSENECGRNGATAIDECLRPDPPPSLFEHKYSEQTGRGVWRGTG